MWKHDHRRYADRRGLRYPIDLTEAEWAMLAPMIPPASQARWSAARCRRPRSAQRHLLRALYRLPVESLPKDLPPKSTAHYYFMMRHTLHIDEEHIKAILAEVGERLRIILWLEGRQKVPRPIRQSLDRLAEVDHGIELKTSPSIVPAENEGWLRRLLPMRFR